MLSEGKDKGIGPCSWEDTEASHRNEEMPIGRTGPGNLSPGHTLSATHF